MNRRLASSPSANARRSRRRAAGERGGEPCPPPAASRDAAASLQQGALRVALARLSDRERHVLGLRFGLADGDPRTLEEVGKSFQLTRERIRQIEAKALSKLRHPSSAGAVPSPLAVSQN